MLKVCRKGEVAGGQDLTREEDEALRVAFGRFARPKARAAGAEVVRRYQHAGFGNWFLCSCLGPGVHPPTLVPVLESYIRRHTDPPWPPHADGCDFYRDPSEQKVVTGSYALPSLGPLRLLRRFGNADETFEPGLPVARSYSLRREALATLLMRLITEAGLNRTDPESAPPKLGEQFKALRAAARKVELDQDLPVASSLCTYLPALPEFVDKIAAAPAARFPKTRPHGILLAVVAGMGHGNLIVGPDTTIPVRGRISVFGERDGNGRDTPAERAARAPYLAICLVGRPAAQQPVTVLRAYAHPCRSAGNLMLVDSNLERHTLDQLMRLRKWLRDKQGIRLEIEKPLFDIAGLDDPEDPAIPPREPCIPDFILRAKPAPVGGSATLLVETMGYADDVYRARKAVMHELMTQVARAPIVHHDFHFPGGQAQEVRDRRFWLDARWAVTGHGNAGALGQPGRLAQSSAPMQGVSQ